jgi:hypothetical protein
MRTTAARTLRAGSAFMSVHQRSGLVFISEYQRASAVRKKALGSEELFDLLAQQFLVLVARTD